MIKLKYIFIFISVLVVFTACHHDVEDIQVVDIRVPGPEIVEPFDGDLTVFVSDVNGDAIEGVDVFVYEHVQKTDAYGIVKFVDIPLDMNGTYVRALKDAFLFGSDKFFPTTSENYSVVRMFPIESLVTVNSSDNVVIPISGGGQLRFKANSFVDFAGNDYDGEINVSTYLITADDPQIMESMPGALLGLSKDGRTQVLGNYGILAIDVSDKNGSTLELKESKLADIIIPIAEELIDDAPQKIPLWSFDNISGNWIEDGEGIFVDGHYEGQVSHFSYWSCNTNFDLVRFHLDIRTSAGIILPNLSVVIRANDVAVGYFTTDYEGQVNGWIPKGEKLSIHVLKTGCSDALYSSEIGAFDNNVILDEIVLDDLEVEYAYGTLYCSGIPLAYERVYIVSENESNYVQTDENGEFVLLLSESVCNPDLEIIIFGYDTESKELSEVLAISYFGAKELILDVCADCDFSLEIIETNNDFCELDVTLFTEVSGGSGDYSYLWNTSLDESSITTFVAGLYCVTVTDLVTDCEQFTCIEIVDLEKITVTGNWSNIDCNDTGNIDIQVEGGLEPYSYSWQGPGGFVSINEDIDLLTQEGQYKVTVTDENDCIVDFSFFISNLIENHDLDIFTDDGNNVICGDFPKFLTVECDGCPIDLNTVNWIFPDMSTQVGMTVQATIPGIYSVEWDSGSCSGFGQIQMQKATIEPPVVELICFEGGYSGEVTNLNVLHTEVWPDMQYATLIEDFPVDNTVSFSIISEYASCMLDSTVELPYVTEFEIIEIIPATCDSCADGFIIVNTDNVGCNNCEYENYYIYAEGEYDDDLKIVNSEKLMTKGSYFVVVKSTEGCVVFSSIVEL